MAADETDWSDLEAECAELAAEEAGHDAAQEDCAACQQRQTLDALAADLTAEVTQAWRLALAAEPQDTMRSLLLTLDEADDPVALAGARAALAEALELAAAEEGTDIATMAARRRLPGVLEDFIGRVATVVGYLDGCPFHDHERHLVTAAEVALDDTCAEDLATLRLALPPGGTPGTMLELSAALDTPLELASGRLPAHPPTRRPPLPHSLNEQHNRRHLMSGELRHRLLGHAGHQAPPAVPVQPERKPTMGYREAR